MPLGLRFASLSEATPTEMNEPSLRVAFVSHIASMGGGAESSLFEGVTALARHSS
jgi:hypothetical protein